MRYTERKEFLFDTELFKRFDTQNALRIYAEYVRTASPVPYPKFFVASRGDNAVDHLWHMPLTERTVFHRELNVPAIVQFERPDWSLTRLGIIPSKRYKFTIANLHLHPEDESAKEEQIVSGKPAIRLDYFPQRGDQIFFTGHRLMLTKVVLEPNAYWGQTNVWLGLICEACVAPEGDARPIPDLSQLAPAEKPGAQVLPNWPGNPPTGPLPPHTWP